MNDPRGLNIAGALAVALSDAIHNAAQAVAPERGPAAAALMILAHLPGIGAEEVRTAVGLSHPGAVRLIDRLQARGLVTRAAHPVDARRVALRLTDAGEAMAAEIARRRMAAMDKALAALDPVEAQTFTALADKMLRALVTSEADALQICRLCEDGACRDCPVEAKLAAA
ncbi:MAG: MarR family winged helix-turn-helix transcriptional regulator [Sphingomonas sp.]